jgi:hypothetical protein
MTTLFRLPTIALFIVGAAFGVSSAQADKALSPSIIDSTEAVRYVVRLPRTYRNPANSRDTVGVTVTATDGDLAGFDLKIGSDATGISIADILPGELGDSCGWEYFAARDLGSGLFDEPIHSLWKIVGLAKSTADTSKPDCDKIVGEVTVARLVIEYDQVAIGRDTLAALFFYWEDCRDNSLASSDGARMAISRQVHDYLQRPQNRNAAIFPTRTGAPSQCVKLSLPNRPRRVVDFHNGGINLLQSPDEPVLPVEPEMPAEQGSADSSGTAE